MQKSNSVRLLLKDYENYTRAVPVNDDLLATSGIQGISLSRQLSEAKQGLDSNLVTTIDAGVGRFYVAKGIAEIFQMAAQAERTGAPTVDLTAESGDDAIVRLATKRKQAYTA